MNWGLFILRLLCFVVIGSIAGKTGIFNWVVAMVALVSIGQIGYLDGRNDERRQVVRLMSVIVKDKLMRKESECKHPKKFEEDGNIYCWDCGKRMK